MKFKFIIYTISLTLTSLSCNTKQEKPYSTVEVNSINPYLPSLYPFNNQYLELQNLEITETFDEERSIKATNIYKNNLKTDLYTKWCKNGECFQLNSNLILEVVPQNNSNSIKATVDDINFIIPNKNGIVSVTSLPNENIYTIKIWDNNLIESWNTIYERSKIDSNGQNEQYAKVLGYNDQLLVFNSSILEIPKSGYVLLNNGYKKQEEYQWSGILIDEDNTTVLGQIILNSNLSFSIRIGNTIIDLPESVTGYSKCNALVHGNKITIGFYHQKSDLIKIITLDYHSGDVIWENSISSAKSIKGIQFSAFKEKFIVEIYSNDTNSLYIFNKENGNLMGKF